MIKSEAIDKLATALNKFQSQVKAIDKNAVNPFFKSKYADLNGIWDGIREPLTSNGLSVIQTLNTGEFGTSLETILLHTSGQFISGNQPVIAAKADAQSLGSAISYSRRYSLSALLGLTADDDDGNEASGKKDNNHKPAQTPQVTMSEREQLINASLKKNNVPEKFWKTINQKMEGKPGKELLVVAAEVQNGIQ